MILVNNKMFRCLKDNEFSKKNWYAPIINTFSECCCWWGHSVIPKHQKVAIVETECTLSCLCSRGRGAINHYQVGAVSRSIFAASLKFWKMTNSFSPAMCERVLFLSINVYMGFWIKRITDLSVVGTVTHTGWFVSLFLPKIKSRVRFGHKCHLT